MARKRALRIEDYAGLPISWERARLIFDNPQPPKTVWEQQFDYADEALAQLARTPHEEIDLDRMAVYYQDLAFVELQPEVFAYLFPACLMDWHRTLHANSSCGNTMAEFHFGLHLGNVFEKMMTPRQREAVTIFFRDSFLERLDRELQFAVWAELEVGSRVESAPTFVWMRRFNSLGKIIPRIDTLWDAWWKLETPGRAVAALQYCSGLMYLPGENPLFMEWEGSTPDIPREHADQFAQYVRGMTPEIWLDDAETNGRGWLPENLEFISRTLTPEFVNGNVPRAIARLSGTPQHELARKLEDDLPNCQDLISERVHELPKLLAEPDHHEGWSV